MLQKLDLLIGFVTIIGGASLLITIWVQAVSWVLALRGRNLRDGLVEVFKSAVPKKKQKELESQLDDLMEHILTKGPLGHAVMPGSTGMKAHDLATAVRPGELGARRQQLRSQVESSAEKLDASLKSAGEAAKTILDSIPNQAEGSDITDDLKELEAKLKLDPSSPLSGMVRKLEQRLTTTVSGKLNSLENWLNSTMDRIEQRLASQTRFWGIVGAVIVAWSLQLSTFDVWERLSKDSQARAKLVAMSGVIADQANEILDADLPLSAGFHQKVLDSMGKDDAYADDLKKLKAGSPPPEQFASSPAIYAFLKKQLGDGSAAFIEAYRNARLELAGENLDAIVTKNQSIVNSFDQVGFPLIDPDYPTTFGAFVGYRDKQGNVNFKRFFGLLVTAGLLSLGAPFWFNTLKSLASLRPVLANRVDADRQPGTPAPVPKT